MFADRLFNIPYSEYWLPLVIGLGVGFCAVAMLRSFLVKPDAYVPPEEKKKPDPGYDPFQEGSRSDQRRSFRRGGHPVPVLFAPPERKDMPNEGWVIDRSMGGMCLGVPVEVSVGTIISLLPANAPPMTPWVDVAVRSCRTVDGQVELGVQFVKVPPWSILLLFG
jgi:hypothetical protein